MKDILRYDLCNPHTFGYMGERENGFYVEYDDAKKIIEELEEQVQELEGEVERAKLRG